MAQTRWPGLWRRTPRPWHGMTPAVWWRLWARNRFAVSPGRWPMALAVTALAPLNAAAGRWQRSRYGKVVAVAAIDPPPLFIIGHWRSGTTLLHELLALDPQFRCPTTYQCMAPAHFLLTEGFVTRRLGFLLPPHRPLDGMRLGWGLPQEDEFALANLGALSPYLAWAFPRRGGAWEENLDPRSFPPAARDHWRRALLTFLRALTLSGPGRLVLKSPPHTARLGLLVEMFPGARFIHLVRHPHQMVPSFVAAWRRMADAVGLQSRCREDLEEALLDLGSALYRRFDADREGLDPGRIVELRYEDLAADPAGEVEGVYGSFGLPHSERIRPLVQAYRAEVGPYPMSRHDPSPLLRRAIAERWGAYARRYGYDLDAGPERRT